MIAECAGNVMNKLYQAAKPNIISSFYFQFLRKNQRQLLHDQVCHL